MRPALLALLLLLLPLPAMGHAILLESQPAAKSAVAAGRTRIVLRFNSRIDAARSRLELRGGGAVVPLRLGDAGPDTLTAEADLVPGAWVVRWQVLAVDGHITRGDVPLVVKGGAR